MGRGRPSDRGVSYGEHFRFSWKEWAQKEGGTSSLAKFDSMSWEQNCDEEQDLCTALKVSPEAAYQLQRTAQTHQSGQNKLAGSDDQEFCHASDTQEGHTILVYFSGERWTGRHHRAKGRTPQKATGCTVKNKGQ